MLDVILVEIIQISNEKIISLEWTENLARDEDRKREQERKRGRGTRKRERG